MKHELIVVKGGKFSFELEDFWQKDHLKDLELTEQFFHLIKMIPEHHYSKEQWLQLTCNMKLSFFSLSILFQSNLSNQS